MDRGRAGARDRRQPRAAIQAPIIWSAQAKLNAATSGACDNRKIKLFRPGATNNLVNFSWNTQACDGAGNPTGAADTGLNAAEQAHFGATKVVAAEPASEHDRRTVVDADQQTPPPAPNLVNFLRGQRGMEGYVAGRRRTSCTARATRVLGDIVNAQPMYVQAAVRRYADPGYAAFKTANAGRTPMLYVAANDGMLHAFYAGTSTTDTQGGKEAWAFVPRSVLPAPLQAGRQQLPQHPRVLRRRRAERERRVDDGTGAWKTILVGGLNDGGRGLLRARRHRPARARRRCGSSSGATPATTRRTRRTAGRRLPPRLDVRASR